MSPTLTRTINRAVQDTVEFTLPHYRKANDIHWYAITEPDYCIQVTMWRKHPETIRPTIAHTYTGLAWHSSESEECSREEFEEAFNDAMNMLTELTIPKPAAVDGHDIPQSDTCEASDSLQDNHDLLNQ